MSNKNLINEFLDYKENIARCSVHTIRAYKNDLNQYLEFLSKKKILLLSSKPKDIQSYLSELGRKHISSTSMARKLPSIKSL